MANSLDALDLTRSKHISALTTKGGSSKRNDFELLLVESFSSYSTNQVSSEGACAILCTKDKQKTCKSFAVTSEDGILFCKLSESVSGRVSKCNFVSASLI